MATENPRPIEPSELVRLICASYNIGADGFIERVLALFDAVTKMAGENLLLRFYSAEEWILALNSTPNLQFSAAEVANWKALLRKWRQRGIPEKFSAIIRKMQANPEANLTVSETLALGSRQVLRDLRKWFGKPELLIELDATWALVLVVAATDTEWRALFFSPNPNDPELAEVGARIYRTVVERLGIRPTFPLDLGNVHLMILFLMRELRDELLIFLESLRFRSTTRFSRSY